MDTKPIERSMTKVRLACTQTLCYFSFRSFGNIGERASEASTQVKRASESERGAQERKIFSSSPTPTLVGLAVQKSEDFEEKIEGL